RFAFLPAIAFAQVITFLVSNDYGKKNWVAITNNIKKVTLVAFMLVFAILLVLVLYQETIVSFFDKKGDFTQLAARAFPILSVLVLFDLLQLVLAGALRGASDVRTVMFTRLIVVFGFF